VQQPAKLEADRQLPLAGEIFLDHVGHFVCDREAAALALARAGFAPTPASIQVNPDPAGGVPQPTGTGNVTAMLARGYVEVLFKTADTPLGRELEAALARYGGIHLAAFAVADAAAAHRRIAAAGFPVRPLTRMQRPVETGAAPGTAAFTLARVEPGVMPEGRIQILTHHTEAMVWQPRWLDHPNGALALRSVTIAVADLGEAAERFSRFTGRTAAPSPWGCSIALDRGRIELANAEGFTRLVPQVDIPSLPFVGAYGIQVRSLPALGDMLRRNGIEACTHAGTLAARFPDALGRGAWLFEQRPAE
jgi:hypothetical protein